MGRHSRFCFGLSSLCSFFLLFFANVIQAQVQPQITQAIDNTLRVTLKGTFILWPIRCLIGALQRMPSQ